MALPGINIEYQNGAVGGVEISPDGVFGMVGHVTPGGALETGKSYVFKGMSDVAAAEILDTVDNHRVYKALKEFYDEAGEGAEVWFLGMDKATTPQDWVTSVDGNPVPVQKLIDDAQRKLRALFFVINPSGDYIPSVNNGLDDLCKLAVGPTQVYLDSLTSSKYAPMFCIIDGYGFSGNVIELEDLKTRSENRVGILIGDSESSTGPTASKGSAVGVLSGRLASFGVQVNAGKVRNGPLTIENGFILDKDVSTFDVESIHDKGYITLRTHVGRAGYFFSDDPLATAVSDDYSQITHRRTIDKAYRIAYDTLLEYLLDDLSLNNDGSVSAPYAKSIEGVCVRALAEQMTNNGELSFDPADNNDQGVVIEIDPTHNVASTSTIKVKKFQVRPKGHTRFFDVPLGFVPVSNS